ncbi:IS110 family transposase [Dehalococcoidia bacterium]|nr:IS110 family transposase [Dehalococcoidia bacterium]
MGKRGKKSIDKVPRLDSLKQINLNAAGLDIGAAEIYACVPEDRDEQSVRVFQTFTTDLHNLANWLAACGVDTVAMESTGIYWIPIYEILEARGFKAHLINARQLKNVPGRKTDVLDCQWIQQLHTYGLLSGSFRPESEMCALRSYTRHRDNLIRYRAAHIQHMQKALHLMNVQLTNVITDITGVTGMNIIQAILSGERHPEKLAEYRNEHCARSQAEIAESLRGNYQPEHLFALKQAVEMYDFYNQQIAACDREIEAKYAAFKYRVDIEEKPLKPPKRKRNQPEGNAPDFDLRSYLYQIAGVDLTQIDGLDVLTVQTILSETGLDMSKWPTVKHYTSWLCLSPYRDVSGGKTLRTGTKKTKNRANKAYRMAAQSLSRSKSSLGSFYRRMKAKHGAPIAIVATAHKLARIVYSMLKYGEEYVDPGADYYEEKHRERAVRNLKRKAQQLGFTLAPISA